MLNSGKIRSVKSEDISRSVSNSLLWIKVPITGTKNRGRGKRDGAMFSLRYRTKHCDPKNATVSCENVKISAI